MLKIMMNNGPAEEFIVNEALINIIEDDKYNEEIKQMATNLIFDNCDLNTKKNIIAMILNNIL